MSNKENDLFIEHCHDRFQEYAADWNWNKINSLFNELEEAGFGADYQNKLLDELTEEQLAEFKKFNSQDDGGDN